MHMFIPNCFTLFSTISSTLLKSGIHRKSTNTISIFFSIFNLNFPKQPIMALWLFRAGSSGIYENKFLDESKIYLTWDGLMEKTEALTTRRRIYDPNGSVN